MVGLGFGEGNVDQIMPILNRAAQEPNIFLVSKDEATVKRYEQSFKPGVRKDATHRTEPVTPGELSQKAQTTETTEVKLSNRTIVNADGKEITLNTQQDEALNDIEDWTKTDETSYVLKGYAGTGKTTLVLDVLKNIISGASVAVAAPTHKAVQVLKNVAGVSESQSSTIQSLLGMRADAAPDKYDPNNTTFYIDEDEIKIGEYDYVIIDESSMINQELSKLLDRMAAEHNTKILYMGDPAQLNPVGETTSRVFDKRRSKELTMVMRQTGGNPLFKIYTAIRNNLSEKLDRFSHVSEVIKGDTPQGMYFTNKPADFIGLAIKKFREAIETGDASLAKIITPKNKSVSAFNQQVRNALFGKGGKPVAQIEIGEIITAYETIGTDSPIIRNGVDYIVRSMEDVTSVEGISMTRVTAEDSLTGDSTQFDVVKPEGLREYYTRLSALHEAKKLDPKNKNLTKQIDRFKENHVNLGGVSGKSLGFSGGWIKPTMEYGYAITVHKSQGSTYTNVFINEDEIDGWVGLSIWMAKEGHSGVAREPTAQEIQEFVQEQNRMKYVAFTRPSAMVVSLSKKAGRKVSPATLATRSTKPSDHIKRTDPRISTEEANRDINETELQHEGTDRFNKIVDDPKAYIEILTRLSKKFPFISYKELDLLLVDGIEETGMALGTLVKWSRGKATLDTVPHEFAHVYINIMSEDKLVKHGINKFKEKGDTTKQAKERLAQYMGEYYADRMTGSVQKRFGMWAKQFWLMLKNKFSNLDIQDTQELIASRFYGGRMRGADFSLVSQTVETHQPPNNAQWGDNPSDIHMISYWERELGIHFEKTDHAKMIQAAVNNIDSFRDFEKEFSKWFEKRYEDKKAPEKFLRQFFNKHNSRIRSFDRVAAPSGRISYEAIMSWNPSIRDWDVHLRMKGATKTNDRGQKFELASGNVIQEYYVSNFIEEQGLAERTLYLSLADVVREITPKDGGQKFYVQSDLPISGKQLQIWDDGNAKQYDNGDNVNLITFVGIKGGTGGQVLFSKLDKAHANGLRDATDKLKYFTDYLQKEMDDGNMSSQHMTALFGEGYERSKGPLSQESVFGQVIARHEWWKAVQGDSYLLGTHLVTDSYKQLSVQDHFNRLRIPLTEGYVPRGMGDSKIMTVDAKGVDVYMGGKLVKPVNSQDGWLMSSGSWFSRLHEATGIKNLAQVKGVIRHLEKTEDSLPDNYIGTKMMQMVVKNGMEFRRRGQPNPFARVVGRGFANKLVHLDEKTGKVLGEFDHLSTTNESKLTSGRFSDFYTVQTIPEQSQKLIQVQDKSKRTAAFPVTWGELGTDAAIESAMVGKTPVGKNFLSALNSYYDKIMDQYYDTFNDLLDNPNLIYDEIYKELEDGQAATNLQAWLEVMGPDGKGVQHTSISDLWIKSLRRRFFTQGVFKLRNKEKGNATQLYYKPSTYLDIPDKTVSVSSENRTMVNYIQKLYVEKRREDDPNYNFPLMPFDEKITTLNDFLKGNTVDVLVSRQPISKVTGVVVRRVHSLVKSRHGETIFMRDEDVLYVFDGDWDGDKGMIEMIADKKTINAFKALRNSKVYKEKKKAVDLEIFFQEMQGTDISNREDINNVASNIANTSSAIGMAVNSRNIMFSLRWKSFSMEFEDGIIAKAFKSTDRVLLDYIKLDHDKIKEDQWDRLYAQGDFIKNNKGHEYSAEEYKQFLLDRNPSYLNTTKEHEWAILVQMAVDDSNFGFLGQINFSVDFLVRRMFKNTSTGKGISGKKHVEALKAVRRLMNFNPIRQGIDPVSRKKLSLYDLFRVSRQMASRFNPIFKNDGDINTIRNRNLLSDILKELATDDLSETPIVNSVNISDRLTPQERLLVSLTTRVKRKFIDVKGTNMVDPRVDVVPVRYTKSASTLAHTVTALRMHSKYVKAIMSLNPDERANAVDLMNSISEDFYKYFNDAEKQYKFAPRDSDSDPKIEVGYDYIEDMANLIDKYYERFHSLSPEAQVIATVYFLGGTNTLNQYGRVTSARFRTKLLPPKLMHGETMKEFLADWDDEVRNPTVQNLTPQQIDKAYANSGFDFRTTTKNQTNLIKKSCGG